MKPLISADLDFYKHAFLPPNPTYFLLWHPVACMQPMQGGPCGNRWVRNLLPVVVVIVSLLMTLSAATKCFLAFVLCQADRNDCTYAPNVHCKHLTSASVQHRAHWLCSTFEFLPIEPLHCGCSRKGVHIGDCAISLHARTLTAVTSTAHESQGALPHKQQRAFGAPDALSL